MTPDEYNKLKAMQATFQNAFEQKDIFWAMEILASGLMSLDSLIQSGKKQHTAVDYTKQTPCPNCNPTGVFIYSPREGCICKGKA